MPGNIRFSVRSPSRKYANLSASIKLNVKSRPKNIQLARTRNKFMSGIIIFAFGKAFKASLSCQRQGEPGRSNKLVLRTRINFHSRGIISPILSANVMASKKYFGSCSASAQDGPRLDASECFLKDLNILYNIIYRIDNKLNSVVICSFYICIVFIF